MTNAEIRKILQKAKARLAKPGTWTKGTYEKGKKCCAVGAILKAAGLDHEEMGIPQCPPVEEVFKAANGINGGIEEWNDEERRTKKQVLQAFDKAIKACPLS